ncbi:MAG TPA: GNAT family N-acetyltransferase, partial [Capsulimonadaceae bacterium]|nr:GNAT family N-acetyltransferase [Capsulimonadaceae bacterium]
DIAALCVLDTQFTTDRIYRPIRKGFSFSLVEEAVPPQTKKHDFDPSKSSERASWDFAAIAEDYGQVTAFIAAEHERWNNRINIRHLYVETELRRRGIGGQLLKELDLFARSVEARSLWLETQNTNYTAIQFYLRAGFQFCGFDAGLYDPKAVPEGEVALFFERPLKATTK